MITYSNMEGVFVVGTVFPSCDRGCKSMVGLVFRKSTFDFRACVAIMGCPERRMLIPCNIRSYVVPKRLKDSSKLNNKFLSDRKSTRLNSSHVEISYAVFCLKK